MDIINEYLSKCLWMDFDFGNIDEYSIEMLGCIDMSWREDSLKIQFINPRYISVVFLFSKKDNVDFIEMIEDKAELKKLGLTKSREYTVFKINIEDERPMIIVAESVKCEIYKPHLPKGV